MPEKKVQEMSKKHALEPEAAVNGKKLKYAHLYGKVNLIQKRFTEIIFLLMLFL